MRKTVLIKGRNCIINYLFNYRGVHTVAVSLVVLLLASGILSKGILIRCGGRGYGRVYGN